MARVNNGEAEYHLQNGDSEPNSNAEDTTKSAKAKRKSDMTLEDMYNTPYDFDEDEDEDSDWEPFENHHVVEIAKWFCVNCTIFNLDNFDHCNVCGEHRKSGILKHGYFASPFSQEERLLQNETEIAERDKGSCLQTIASDKSTAIGFDERMLLHEEVEMKSHPHPERPDRLRAIAASLATAGIFPGRCFPILAREIKREELQMVHSSENIEAVELSSNILSCYFTPDTYANQYSACAARLAAGLCADLASAIYSGSAKNGFALVRPPGHHAGVKQSMGFCLHNNAAIAACAAQVSGAKKVLIIDWDVHHGNGTQEIFEKNKSVLYISLHRHEGGKFYPGTGAANQVGTMGAEGYCVNVPWSRGGVGDNDYVFAFQHAVLPIASEFTPDFTIISAGFDAARGDPLGCCDVTPAGYAQMTQMCSALSGGKLLVILEGGYNLRSISSSATAVIKVLLGESPECNLDSIVPTKAGLRTVLEVLKIQMKYWPALEPNFSKLESEWGSYAFHHANSLPKCEISEEWDIIGDSYRLSPKEGSYDELIDRNPPFILHGLMASQDDFKNKRLLKSDFATIRRSVAEARLPRTSSTAYKKQAKQLSSLSKTQQSTEEDEAEKGTSLVWNKRKRSARTTTSATSKTSLPPSTEVTIAAPSIARVEVPISSYPGEGVRKRSKRPASSAQKKESDFLGSKEDDLSEVVLEMLPPETAAAAQVHNKFWTEEWQNHVASCEVEDLLMANNACAARALSLGTAAEDLVRVLRKKNEELEQRIEASVAWEEEVNKAKRVVEEAEERSTRAEVKLDSAKIQVNCLRNGLHKSTSQVAVLTKRIDQSNEYQRIASETLEVANKEKAELKVLSGTQVEEIESLKAELKTAGEAAVQNYKDNFDSTSEYDDFANYWASWSAQGIISRLYEKHPELDIEFIEAEFGGPTGGRPDVIEE